MGARKYLGITTSPHLITVGTGGAALTGFQVFGSDGSTPKSNYTPWADSSTKTLAENDQLSIADDAIYLFLGEQGASVDGQLADAVLAAMLDQYYDGTEVIKFCLANKSVATNVPELDVSAVAPGGDWDNATAW